MTNKSINLNAKAREIASSCACLRLRKATRAVTQYYDAILEKSDLKATQFTLLVAVWLAGPVPIGMLAEEMVMDRTTLTRNLDLLIRDGLVECVPAKDRRAKLIRSTEKGEAALVKAIPLWQEAQDSIVNRLGKQNWKEISTKLTAMTAIALLD